MYTVQLQLYTGRSCSVASLSKDTLNGLDVLRLKAKFLVIRLPLYKELMR